MAERLTLTIDEVAETTGLSRGAVYRAARSGELPTVRIAGRILVTRDALNKIIEAQAVVDKAGVVADAGNGPR